MQGIDYWRLSDELSVIQAALLIIGENPSGNEEWVQNWEPHNRPDGFDAVLSALKNAINSETLPANIKRSAKYEHYFYEGGSSVGDWEMGQSADLALTTIKVSDLKIWLSHKGIKAGFFFPQGSEERDYLDKNNSNYAPKLAAAVKAWEAVRNDEGRLRGKTPKQALAKFLREHASEYGLTKDDGSPNEDGIEQICKVANWKPEGGAAKTPTPAQVVKDSPTPKKSNDNQGVDDLDDEAIPF